MSEITTEQVVEYIKNMSLMDAAELVKTLEDELGVSAAAPVAVAAAGVAGGAAAEDAQTEFKIVLEEAGGQKVKVIKVVRALTGLGLKEAKELVDSAPSDLKEGVSKEEGEEVLKQLEEAGAKGSLK